MSAPKIELTSREKEVLELLSTGYNSKEIGEKIFISSNTYIIFFDIYIQIYIIL